jgi:DNA topoisomerase-1
MRALARAASARERGEAATSAKKPGTGIRHEIVRAMEEVAEHLGNTPAVARGSYVHPAVVGAYEAGASFDAAEDAADDPTPTRQEEKTLLALLRRARREERRSARSRRARSGRGDAGHRKTPGR